MRWARVAGAATAGVLTVLLAACAGPSSDQDPGPDDTPATSTQRPESPGSDAPTVAPPGPREGRLWSADILVQWDGPLPAATVRRIGRLEAVARTQRLGLAQVPIQDRVLTVAAVDPRAYRLFTSLVVADLDEGWERVAAGEMMTTRELASRLGDDSGAITLGASDAPSIHVGAYAPQVPTIDMVVNQAWAGRIGMATDNGLLISTGQRTPATIRRRLQRIVGDEVTVQMLDVASRIGLDPDAVLIAAPTGTTIGGLVGTFRYRVSGDAVIPDPEWVRTHVRTESVPILGSVTCHRDLFPQLRAALEEVVARGLGDEVRPGEYAGCYHPRFIANTTTLSNHAFGLALDLNVPGNQRGTVGEMDRDVVAIFKRWGFAWGGDWSWTDPMHFELAELKRPE